MGCKYRVMDKCYAKDNIKDAFCYGKDGCPYYEKKVEAIPKDQYETRFKTGKWIVHRKSDGEVGYFQCSSCNHHSVVKFPYCPICGAEMDCSPNILSEMKAIPKADYEARLKADLEAILVELQLEIEEKGIVDFNETYVDDGECIISVSECNRLIQEKIDKLKGVKE